MEYKAKIAAALPKGELNGLTVELSEEMYTAIIEGRSNTPHVAILVFDVKKAEVDNDGTRTVSLRIRRVEPLLTNDHRRAAETMLTDAYQTRSGAMMLPFELSQLSKEAFADLPRDTAEIDEKEEAEREMMTPHDELRRHLIVVHGRPEASTMTDGEADHRHQADHDGDLPDILAHDPEWIGWTRADLEAATSETDDESSGPVDHDGDGETGVILSPIDDEDVEEADADNVRPLFSGAGN